MTNHAQWPEIKQFPQQVCYVVSRWMDVCEQSARIIQRRWRCRASNQQIEGDPVLNKVLRWKRSDIDAFFTNENATATTKLDGTNVGIDHDGNLYGRRTRIASDATHYQKCPIDALRGRAPEIISLRTKLAKMTGFDGKLDDCPLVLYGELCCNRLYDYEEAGDFKAWRIFGVVIDITAGASVGGPELVNAFEVTGLKAVFCPHDSLEDAKGLIRLAMCERLRDIIEGTDGVIKRSKAVCCLQEVYRGSLVNLVHDNMGWMASAKGEGLVLAHQVFGLDASSDLTKWKCSHEPQPKNIKLLRDLQERLCLSFPPAVHSLLPKGVPATIDQLYHIATVPVQVAAKKPKRSRTTDGKNTELQAGVQVAIESAVTKFDAIESYFERGERTAIVQLLRDEVLTDLKFSASSSEGKHVNSAVNRHVGIEFGKWKKGKS